MDEILARDTEQGNPKALGRAHRSRSSDPNIQKSWMIEVAGNLLKELKDKQSLEMLDTEVSLDLPFLSRNFFYLIKTLEVSITAWCSQRCFTLHT